MDKRAQVNQGRITKPEFLEAIAGPYMEAFTVKNVQKAFEVTGTWPVDRTKITPDKIAPSKGLSVLAGPTIEVSSPVKAICAALDNLFLAPRAKTSQHNDSSTPVPSTPPPRLTFPTNSPLPDAEGPTASTSALGPVLLNSRAAFLFKDSSIRSSDALPPIDINPAPTYVHFTTKSQRSMPSGTDQRSRADLVKANSALVQDVDGLAAMVEVLQRDRATLQAQIALQTLENNQLRFALGAKEVKQTTARSR